jgi:small-conductance mechanosensitive channel
MHAFMIKFQAFLDSLPLWVNRTLFSYDTLGQLGVVFAAFILAYGVGRLLGHWLARTFRDGHTYLRLKPVLGPLLLPLLWLFLVYVTFNILRAYDFPVYLLHTTATLLALWLVIRLASNAIRNQDLARMVTAVAWAIAALSIAGLLEPVMALLDDAAITLGGARISALLVVTGLFTFAVLIWGALFIARILEQSLSHVPTLTPSAQVLMGKLVKIVLVIIAVLMAISSTGINLTAFAVFGGAIGVGLGFGLQKVVSNLISGVILLLDSSIKPGDVVEVGETYGWINKLAARYTSVITRDGKEILIPNEDMITRPVINWTHSDSKVRRGLPLGVSYRTDLKRAMALTLEAAGEVERVLSDPKPNCLIKKFGDNAVELELRIWIADPQNGMANVSSLVYLRIWEKFHENNIELPYPQRDLHIISAPAFKDPRLMEEIGKAWAAKAEAAPEAGGVPE